MRPGMSRPLGWAFAPGAGQRRLRREGETRGLIPRLCLLADRGTHTGRSLSPFGAAASWRWRKASDLPVLKHGPRSAPSMRAGGWQTHEAQVT